MLIQIINTNAISVVDALYYGIGCGIALAIYALGLWIYNKGFEAGIKARRK